MIFSALLASNTGLQAAASFLDVVSNNLANSGTTGFKTVQPTFQDLLYVGERPGAIATPPGVAPPQGTQLGTGTRVDDLTALFTQGALVRTDVPLDIAITGEGFFAVTLPDGTTGYTRAGNLTTDVTGQIVTSDGFRLADGITLPPGTSSVSISSDGVVTATTPDGDIQVGNITLTRFQNPAGLLRVGRTTFTAGTNSGPPVTGAPGANGLGTLNQGFLEQSNVEIVSELTNLIIAQRAFSFNSQAIQVENQVLQATTSLIQ